MPKIKVGIIGATGYTGAELLKLLLNHPQVEIQLATSESYAEKKVGEVLPHLRDKTPLIFERTSNCRTDGCKVIFSCLPHKEGFQQVPRWMEKGAKVIDLSADFRLKSPETYAQWYETHPSPELLKTAVYGLPEIHREEIKKAHLIGNPGCYPTGAILGLAPFVREGLIDLEGIIIDAKSGVSGAGRSPALESLFSEVNESVHAYKVGSHRHTPEIEQELSGLAGREVSVTFTPHLVPMDRGILSTIYARPSRKTDSKKLLETLSSFYRKEPFITVLPQDSFPRTKAVRGTNRCQIGALYNARTDHLIIVTAIDNLMKGASSQAVQNMNLMCGFEESTGLELPSLVP